MKTRLLFLSLLISFFVNAQTLYWVGGSGNWSDSNHWSLESGGAPSGVSPKGNTNVVFDNNSDTRSFIVEITQSIEVKSLNGINTFFNIDLISKSNIDVTFSAEVDLSQYFHYKINGKTYLKPEINTKYQFAHAKFSNDIILSGNSEIEFGVLNTEKSVFFNGDLILKTLPFLQIKLFFLEIITL